MHGLARIVPIEENFIFGVVIRPAGPDWPNRTGSTQLKGQLRSGGRKIDKIEEKEKKQIKG